MSIDGFSAFQHIGMDNTTAIALEGLRYRDTILAMGGGRAPGLVFQVCVRHAVHVTCMSEVCRERVSCHRLARSLHALNVL